MDESSNEQVHKRLSDDELAEAVLAYLAEFPEAMDSLDGVADWWVTRRQVKADVEDLLRVLGQLIDKGLLEQIGTGVGAHYRLKKQQG